MAKNTGRASRALGFGGSPFETMSPLPIVADRAPRTTDLNFPIGQQWINQPLDDIYELTSVAAGAAHWEVINAAAPGSAPISKYIVDADGTAGYTTIQAAINAAVVAGLPATVYVRPGTYTENLTLYTLIDIVGAVGVGDTGACTIIGLHTPPAAGAITLRNLYLQSATHIFSSAVAGTATIILMDNFVAVTNGYTFNLPNWTGSLVAFDVGQGGTNNGEINNTGGATIFYTNVTAGQGAGNSAIISGAFEIYNVVFNCPISIQGAATGTISGGSWFYRTLTTAATATVVIANSYLSTGATAAISHGSANALSLSNVSISTSNNPAIAGAGAGAVTLSGVEFTDGSNLAATLTLSSAAETRSTKLLCGDSVYRVNAFTNENDVVQAYAIDATAAGAGDRNAIEGNLQVTSGNGNHTPDAVQGAIFAIAGANVLTTFGVRGFCDQADGSVIASTAAGVEGHLNLRETNAADLPAVYAFAVKGYLDSTDAAGVPGGMTAGVGSVVEYNTPFNTKAYGFVASRLNSGGGAGTAAQAAYGVLQGTVAAADWLYGLDLYNGAAGVAYTTADIRFQNQSKIAVATTGVTFSGNVAGRSFNPTNTNIASFDVDVMLQSKANTGAAPTGATGDYNIMYMQDRTVMEQFILGAGQTIIAPRLQNDGLLISLDLTVSEGAEYYFGHTTRSRHRFTIGSSPAFFIESTFKVADCGTSDPLWIGFRILGAPNAAYATYTDACVIGLHNTTNADTVITGKNLNNTGWAYVNSTNAWTDGQTHTIRLDVSAAGVCSYLLDGVALAASQAMTFDNGDVVIPFIHHLFAAAGAPAAIHMQSLKCGFSAWT